MNEELKLELGPLHDRIVFLAESVETEQKTKSGIILVQQENQIQYAQATVLAVGTGRITNGGIVPLAMQVGDRFLYNIQAASKFRLNGVDYSQVRESDIITKIAYIPKKKVKKV